MVGYKCKGDMLRTILGEKTNGVTLKGVGNINLVGELKGGRTLLIYLYKGRVSDRYLGIKLSVLTKDKKVIDSQTISFNSCASKSVINQANKNRGFYVWDSGTDYDWYIVRPDKETLDKIKAYTKKYVSLYK